MEYVVAAIIMLLVYLYDRFSKKLSKTDEQCDFNDWVSECSCSDSTSDVIITIHR